MLQACTSVVRSIQEELKVSFGKFQGLISPPIEAVFLLVQQLYHDFKEEKTRHETELEVGHVYVPYKNQTRN